MSIYHRALKTYGRDAQLNQAQEECAELIVAVNHYRRGRKGDVEALAGEIADVQIMMAQLELVVGPGYVAKVRVEKLARLEDRMSLQKPVRDGWRPGVK